MPRTFSVILSFLFSLFLFTESLAASLPKSTQEILKKLKLDPNLLSDIDREIQVPKDWVERARQEGQLRVVSTFGPGEIKEFFAPFRERYPFLSIEHSDASREVRSVKTLTAFKSGKIITDVLFAVGGTFFHYKEAGALEDLRVIPAVKNSPVETRDKDGLWVGTDLIYWCMAYNTKLARKEDLPKKWEDLLGNPKWAGGNVALVNRPNLWALQLWKAKGEKWTKDFLEKLFAQVKPQLRKEGQGALLELLSAGEFQAVIPAREASTYEKVVRGAPLGFTCPEPVPASATETVILKGAPNLHAARLFMQWLLSKEGQIAQYAASHHPPVHRGLQRAEFIPFADDILGKPVSYRDPGLETEVLPQLLDFWNNLWSRGGKAKS